MSGDLDVLRDFRIDDDTRRLLRLVRQLNIIHFSQDLPEGEYNPVAIAHIGGEAMWLTVELPVGGEFIVWSSEQDDAEELSDLTAPRCIEAIRAEMELFIQRYAGA